jgi:hypothetical protein
LDLAGYITAAPPVDSEHPQGSGEEKHRLLNSMEAVVLDMFSEKTPKTLHHKASDLVKKVNEIRQDPEKGLVLGLRRHTLKTRKKMRPTQAKRGPKASRKAATRREGTKAVKQAPSTTEAEALLSKDEEKSEIESTESLESSFEDSDSELSDSDELSDRRIMLGHESSDDELDDEVNPSNRYWEVVWSLLCVVLTC